MRSKFFSIFKTLFAVVMLAATITVFFVGCNPTDKKDTTDKGNAASKEITEKQALIDDWLENKTLKIEKLGTDPYITYILYDNILYTKYYERNTIDYHSLRIKGRLIELKDGEETLTYQARFNMKTLDIYDPNDGNIVDYENKYYKHLSFYNNLADECYCVELTGSSLLKKYFISNEFGVYVLKNDAKAMDIITDAYWTMYGLDKLEDDKEAFSFMRTEGLLETLGLKEVNNFEEMKLGMKKACEQKFGEEYKIYDMSVEFKENEIVSDLGISKTRFSIYKGEIKKLQPEL